MTAGAAAMSAAEAVANASNDLAGPKGGSGGRPARAGKGEGSHGFGAFYGGMMTEKEAEQALLSAKKECEALEKKLLGLVKRNKKLAGF